MLYQTTEQEIIKLFEIYQELKEFINSIENAKKYLLNNNITRKTNSYTILKLDASTYNNFRKVYKIMFNEMIDRTQLNKFVLLYQEYSNKYMINIDDTKIYLRNRNNKILILDEFEKKMDTIIFNNVIFYDLKEIIKTILYNKLNNIQITNFYFNN